MAGAHAGRDGSDHRRRLDPVMARLPAVPDPPPDRPRDLRQEMLDLGREIRVAQDALLKVAARQRFAQDESAEFFTALTAFCGVLWRMSTRWAAQLDEMRDVASRQHALDVGELSKAAAAGASGVVMRGLSGAVDRLVVVRYRWLFGVIALGGVLLGALICGAGVYVTHTPVPPMSCFSERGGAFCGYWQTAPTEPAPAAEPAQPAPQAKTRKS